MYLQMCPQMSMVTLVIGCIFLSFVHCVFFSSNVYCKNRDQNRQSRTGCIRFFSTVWFQMSPQIVCPKRGKVTLVAFIWFFPKVWFQMFTQITWIRKGKVPLITFLYFSALCVFKCLLKLFAQIEVKSHLLH